MYLSTAKDEDYTARAAWAMMLTRRTFLTTAAGRGAAVLAPHPRWPSRPSGAPSARTRAFMAKYGLKYPVLQAPSGGQDLAAAISNAGGMGAFALWRTTRETARQNVEHMRTLTKNPFIVNYVLTFEPESLPAALDAGAPIVQFSWGVPTSAVAANPHGRRHVWGPGGHARWRAGRLSTRAPHTWSLKESRLEGTCSRARR